MSFSKPDSRAEQRAKYFVGDVATGFLAFLLFNVCRFYLLGKTGLHFSSLTEFLLDSKMVAEEVAVPFVMTGVYWLSGYYNEPFGKSRLEEFLTTFFSAGICTGLLFLTLLIDDQTPERMLDYKLIASLFGLLFLLTYLGRLIVTQAALRHFRKHQWRFRTVVVGNSATARAMARRLESGQTRADYAVVGFVSLEGERDVADGARTIRLEELARVCGEEGVDQLVIAPEKMDEQMVLRLLYRLFPLGISIKIAPDTLSILTSAIRLKDIYGEPFVDLTTPAISESSKNLKRVADVMVSALMLLLFIPLFALIAVMVKATSEGPAIYRQERIGRRQRPFIIYKFRTMTTDAESDGPRLSSDSDPRVTRIGRILRKYRLDELPQFWNVLKGDMSLVGPRPERSHYIEKIVKEAPYYALVYQVRPGITSWGMVKYGYASTVEQMVERTRYDLIYLSNMSLFIDIKIMIYTVKTILSGRGV